MYRRPDGGWIGKSDPSGLSHKIRLSPIVASLETDRRRTIIAGGLDPPIPRKRFLSLLLPLGILGAFLWQLSVIPPEPFIKAINYHGGCSTPGR
jgi:hypothetical protein